MQWIVPRILFPIIFASFNLVYWGYYLNKEAWSCLNTLEDIKPSKRPSLQRPLFHIMYSSLRSQVFTRCRTKVQLQRPKKPDFSVTKDLWNFYPGIKACECLPRAYFILTDKWKMYSRPISIVTTDWRVNKLMNTTSKIVYRDQHIIGNCTMAQGNLN